MHFLFCFSGFGIFHKDTTLTSEYQFPQTSGREPSWDSPFPCPLHCHTGHFSFLLQKWTAKKTKNLSITAQCKTVFTFILNSLFHSTHNSTNYCEHNQRTNQWTQSLLCSESIKILLKCEFFSFRVYFPNYTIITAMPIPSPILCAIIAYNSTMGNILAFGIPVTASPGSSVREHTAFTRVYSAFSAF